MEIAEAFNLSKEGHIITCRRTARLMTQIGDDVANQILAIKKEFEGDELLAAIHFHGFISEL